MLGIVHNKLFLTKWWRLSMIFLFLASKPKVEKGQGLRKGSRTLALKIHQDTSPSPLRPPLPHQRAQFEEALSLYPSPREGMEERPGGGARARTGDSPPGSHSGTTQLSGNSRTRDPLSAASCPSGRPPSSLPTSPHTCVGHPQTTTGLLLGIRLTRQDDMFQAKALVKALTG